MVYNGIAVAFVISAELDVVVVAVLTAFWILINAVHCTRLLALGEGLKKVKSLGRNEWIHRTDALFSQSYTY